MSAAEKIDVVSRAAALEAEYRSMTARSILEAAIRRHFPGRIAMTSSFGAEAAVLLHLVAQVAPDLPVLFIDTGKLFGETRRYQQELCARLGLTDIRILSPAAKDVARQDPDGLLFTRDADACCDLRKVRPLAAALEGFDAWITGRKRYQGGERENLPIYEARGKRIKINPLAYWTAEDIDAYFEDHDLPRHPLEAEGYRSIGCMSCTERTAPGADPRSGRWAGQAKTECGIHISLG